MRIRLMLISVAMAAVAVASMIPTTAAAMCHCMVPAEDADEVGDDIFSDATQVVMMREGTQTVLSLRNRYEGPPEDFAMVVPVPMVLEPEHVNTLEDDIFARIDTLTAPRLVEYFEEDPCPEDHSTADAGWENDAAAQDEDGGVSVEAEFKEGEYEITILGAEESTGLEDWLHDHDYNIPEGAAPYLEPYIQEGMYFFVAEVDPEELEFEDGEAILSPLRFHYDTEEFLLPIRLGMINSRGQQDLIVNILAKNQRYEVANYDNITIPTNLEVSEDVADNFGDFYRTLFSETVQENPGAAVTEYAWNAGSCDPCPSDMPWGMFPEDIDILGAEVLADYDGWVDPHQWVISRLHMRYEKDDIGEDLVFEKAEPIVGGREVYDDDGNLEEGAQPGDINEFQARYNIRHAWDEGIDCMDPDWGNWTRQGNHQAEGPNTTGGEVFNGETVALSSVILDVDPHERSRGHGSGGSSETSSGCAAASTATTPMGALILVAALFGLMVVRRDDGAVRISRRRRGRRS